MTRPQNAPGAIGRCPNAEAVFLTGCMPTNAVLAALERDLGKPVASSNAAMMWHELREACEPVAGYGRDGFGRWRDPVYLRTFKLQQSRRARSTLPTEPFGLTSGNGRIGA